MRTISGSRSGGAQRAAAFVVAAGLASAFTSVGTASAETVPPWGTTPSITAVAGTGAFSDPKQTWTPGSPGTPGVVSVSAPPSTTASASSAGNLALGQLSSQSAAQGNGSPVNRRDAGTTVNDGFYLAAPATVTLTYAITGSATSSVTGDGAGQTEVEAVVAIDCPIREGGCFPDDPNDALPTIGKRAGASVNGSQTKPVTGSGTVDIPLTAGWHTVLARTFTSSRGVSTGGSSGEVAMTFSLKVVDEIGEDKVGWTTASDLLPVTGGIKIAATPPPPPPPPPPTPAQLLAALADSIADAQQDGAIRNSRPLLSKVEAAQAALAGGNEAAATRSLTDLRNHLRAQSGKHVPVDLATAWSTQAEAVFAKA